MPCSRVLHVCGIQEQKTLNFVFANSQLYLAILGADGLILSRHRFSDETDYAKVFGHLISCCLIHDQPKTIYLTANTLNTQSCPPRRKRPRNASSTPFAPILLNSDGEEERDEIDDAQAWRMDETECLGWTGEEGWLKVKMNKKAEAPPLTINLNSDERVDPGGHLTRMELTRDDVNNMISLDAEIRNCFILGINPLDCRCLIATSPFYMKACKSDSC